MFQASIIVLWLLRGLKLFLRRNLVIEHLSTRDISLLGKDRLGERKLEESSFCNKRALRGEIKMKKKVIISVFILIVSMFWMLHFDFVANSARATISPSVNGNTLIFNIETLLNLINWNHTDRYLNWFIPQNIALPLVAYQMGIITLTQLADWASTVSNTHSYPVPLVFVVYAELMKYGIENQSEIEWALDNATIMANGLPDTDAMIGLGSGYFATYGTSILWAYYWANKYTYDQSKWNLTKAYSSYKTAVWSAPYPAISKIDAYGNTSPGSGRYYDEAMLTLNAFLYSIKWV
jgi:hypothetical protein